MKRDVRLIYYILKNWGSYFFGILQPIPIGYVILGVTYQCNAKCKMCDIHDFYKENPELARKEFDLSTLLERLKESTLLTKIQHIDLTGGEPFLKENLADFVVGLLNMSQIKLVTMNTNGLCTEKIISDTKAILGQSAQDKCFSLSVSIDGIGTVHDTIRGLGGAFDKVERTVAQLKELKKRYPNFKIRSNAVIQPDNINSLAAIKGYWDSNGIEGAYSLIQNPFYTCRAERAVSSYFSKDDIEKIKSAQPKCKGINYYLGHGFCRPLHCFAGYTALFIDQFGTVYPCNFLARNEVYAMGSIKTHSLDSIWVSSMAWDVRAKIKKCPYTSCWNGCEVEQTLIQFEGIDKIVKTVSLGCLSYYYLRGLRGFA